MPQESCFFQRLPERQLFQNQQYAEKKPPCDKIPRCTVLKAREEPHEYQIAKPAGLFYTVPPKGNVHVIPEPGAKGHMPSAPELSDAFRDVRIVKVLREIKAKDFTKTDCHITVS